MLRLSSFTTNKLTRSFALGNLIHLFVCAMESRCNRTSMVTRGGDVIVEYISIGAKLVEKGLSSAVPVVVNAIDGAGNLVKNMMDQPREVPLLDGRAEIVALAYTDAAKRYTEGAHKSTKKAVQKVRDVSANTIHIVVAKFESEQYGKRLLPIPVCRDALVAVGKVGVASLGAVAVVGEAMYETSKTVALKTAAVTADFVEFKYGNCAGRVIRDTSDTAGNVIRTLAYVAMMSQGDVLLKIVAKNAAKIQLRENPPTPDHKLYRAVETKIETVGSELDRMVSFTLVVSK